MKICSIFWEVQVGFERLLSREGIPVNSLPTAWDPHRPLELWEHELYFALTGSKQLPKNEIKSHDAFVFCLSSLFFSLSTLHKLNCDYLKIKIITQINLAVYQWRKVTCFFLCFSLPHLKGTGQRVLWRSILMSQTEGPGPRKEVRDILLVTGQSQLDGMSVQPPSRWVGHIENVSQCCSFWTSHFLLYWYYSKFTRKMFVSSNVFQRQVPHCGW